jgi:hypothetical protein
VFTFLTVQFYARGPSDHDGRVSKNPQGEAAALHLPKRMPSNFRWVPHLARLGMSAMASGAWSDQDLGASGIVLAEDLGIGLVSGKDGILYTVRLDMPGDTKPADLAPAVTAANYAKLATAPILYTYYDPVINPAPGNPETLNTLAYNRTHHLHGTPILWESEQWGWMHFCGGENGNLRAWQIKADQTSRYLACSQAYASASAPAGGMPGWSIVLSANGGTDGVVWGMIPYGDANLEVTTSRLLAYDASAFAQFPGGGGEITPLWDSQDWNWNILHPKFNRPIVADSKVIVPTYGGQLLVLELA